MGIGKELKRVVKFVEKHGAEKVLEAVEGVVDQGLDALVDKTPDEFKLLAKTADGFAKDRLSAAVDRLDKRLSGGSDDTEASS